MDDIPVIDSDSQMQSHQENPTDNHRGHTDDTFNFSDNHAFQTPIETTVKLSKQYSEMKISPNELKRQLSARLDMPADQQDDAVSYCSI
jgi:hypothetical protein